MSSEVSNDPIHGKDISIPNNGWGLAGYVLAKFGPWGAILVILAAIMWFFTVVYGNTVKRSDQLIEIVQKQSETAVKAAVAQSEQAKSIDGQNKSINDLNSSTQGLKYAVEQLSRDLHDTKNK